MKDFNFRGEIGYDLRNQNIFRRTSVKLVNNATEGVSFLGPKIWEIIPENIKKQNLEVNFKEKIKKIKF